MIGFLFGIFVGFLLFPCVMAGLSYFYRVR